jgi:hypothetical protein
MAFTLLVFHLRTKVLPYVNGIINNIFALICTGLTSHVYLFFFFDPIIRSIVDPGNLIVQLFWIMQPNLTNNLYFPAITDF